MEIQLTSNQILAMAPDSSSATAGKKQSNIKYWKNLGISADALWGECQGSALYQVKIELVSFASQCSCPSRKFPCKHGLGLLLLAATNPSSVPTVEQPEWVTSWLNKRQANSARKQERVVKSASEPASAAQVRTAEKRLANVKKGLDGLDLWLNDIVRQGLASVQTQPDSFWEHQAARLRDAQAPALDTRVRRLSDIPNASTDWPEKLLCELGKIALLTHAFRQEEQLEANLREDVRQLIGWNLSQDEVNVRGETVRDDWSIVGQIVEDEERGKVQRTWLSGLHTGRPAMILQFSYAGQPFPEQFVPGSHQEAELTFWPGSAPLRAQMRTRIGISAPLTGPFSWPSDIEVFLKNVAEILSAQPWQERFLCLFSQVTPLYDEANSSWYLRDQQGNALPFVSDESWQILALSGGHPIDIASEWHGKHLLPLAVWIEDEYVLL